jgi:hypothetical protein
MRRDGETRDEAGVTFRNFLKAPKYVCLQGQQCDWLRTGRGEFFYHIRDSYPMAANGSLLEEIDQDVIHQCM